MVSLGNWREEILQYIDADQLPVHWGGTQTGPDRDPKCLHVVSLGNWREEILQYIDAD